MIRAAHAPRFHLPGLDFTGLAAPSRGSADICTWRLTVRPDRDPGKPHTLDADEIFMVVSGSIQVTPGGETLGPGDAVVVPAGQPILLVNTGEEPADVFVATRAGFTATTADGATMNPPWAQ